MLSILLIFPNALMGFICEGFFLCVFPCTNNNMVALFRFFLLIALAKVNPLSDYQSLIAAQAVTSTKCHSFFFFLDECCF